jgi:hypothetical protein
MSGSASRSFRRWRRRAFTDRWDVLKAVLGVALVAAIVVLLAVAF